MNIKILYIYIDIDIDATRQLKCITVCVEYIDYTYEV